MIRPPPRPPPFPYPPPSRPPPTSSARLPGPSSPPRRHCPKRAPRSPGASDPRRRQAHPLSPWERVRVRARRSEEHTSELQSQSNLVCRLLLEKKKKNTCRRSRHLATKLSLSRSTPSPHAFQLRAPQT